MLISKSSQVKESERKVKVLSSELKNCLEAWEKEKSELKIRGVLPVNGNSSVRFQKLIEDIEAKNSQKMERI